MDELNQRQFERMISLINSFERGETKLGSLVDNLEGLLNATTGVPISWMNTFLGYWGELEDERALLIDEGGSLQTARARTVISNALSQVRRMVLDQLGDPAAARRET